MAWYGEQLSVYKQVSMYVINDISEIVNIINFSLNSAKPKIIVKQTSFQATDKIWKNK